MECTLAGLRRRVESGRGDSLDRCYGKEELDIKP